MDQLRGLVVLRGWQLRLEHLRLRTSDMRSRIRLCKASIIRRVVCWTTRFNPVYES
ncbi:hypothetical protein TSAR_011412 [Trichomalopsis sarcophagae]|uniref:Uncharacterized protein n=1 Tax=Trichomalopsis sarcophagae TaxID=543379 RepID=A0A232F9T0_9HYME|nr:hypothetical protein TSAR_011412 [Trichomalopsis sarcophagae]